jgi:hypothetical protein
MKVRLGNPASSFKGGRYEGRYFKIRFSGTGDVGRAGRERDRMGAVSRVTKLHTRFY